MISRTEHPRPISPALLAPLPPATWQRSLAAAPSNVAALLDHLGLKAQDLGMMEAAARDFPLRVPLSFIRRMRHGDAHDPLLLQVLPTAVELTSVSGFDHDPNREAAASPVPGLLHKYHGRVLLVATGACGVHCRYCFRRHFPYGEHQAWGNGWQQAIDYIATDPSIEEVILSGGDPLSVSDSKLAALATALATLPHVRRLRIHTRMPIVLPERVDDALVAWLGATPLQVVVVVHANHANELDADVGQALARLRGTGAQLLNQAVLLRGINDSVAALADLSEAVFAAGVLPYYLHLLDRVAGAAHFEVSQAEAEQIMAALLTRLPGYLVPRLVREVPGVRAKVPIVVVPATEAALPAAEAVLPAVETTAPDAG